MITTSSSLSNGQYIAAGSDDGSFFIWDRETTNIVRTLRGDDCIVNCVQPHPTTCVLATSGIDKVVRLWSPQPVCISCTCIHICIYVYMCLCVYVYMIVVAIKIKTLFLFISSMEL